jgi:hypothetical protein
MYELFDKLKPYFKEEFEDDFFSSPASLADVEKIENTIGIKLPESYKQFLLKFNDFAIDSLDLFPKEHQLKNSHNIKPSLPKYPSLNLL